MSNIQHFSESNTLIIKGDLIANTVMDVMSEMKLYNKLNLFTINNPTQNHSLLVSFL